MQLTVDVLQNLVRPARPGQLVSWEETLGALSIRCVESDDEPILIETAKTATVHVVGGGGLVNAIPEAGIAGRYVDEQDVIYLPRLEDEDLAALELQPGEGALRVLVAEYGDVKGAAAFTEAPIFIDGDRGLGYWRTQYCGPRYGMADFNPLGVKYRDILWPYIDPAILAQTVEIPPHHRVPAHVHGRAGEPVDGAKVWQWYYCYAGRARIEIGASVETVCEVELTAGDVMVYPNGVAHNILCDAEGCFYIFGEKKADGDTAPPVLEDEFAYEKRLCTRGTMTVTDLLREEAGA